MNELAEFRASGSMRPDALVRRVVRRASPVFGFVAYGILYAVAVVNTVVLVTLLGLIAVLRPMIEQPWPVWVEAIIATLVVAAFLVSWLPFAAWVRRRRREIVLLVRSGEPCDGRVVETRRFHVRGAPVTVATIELVIDGSRQRLTVSFGAHLDDFCEGSTQPVLFHPSSRFALAFPHDGRAVVARRS